jgi:putative nucleotidyltransferase with HDIG domain
MDDIKYILLNPKVKQRIEALGATIELPTLPTVYSRLQEVMNDENANATKAANIIENDQALSLKILRTVNSAAFGLRNEVTSIRNAIAMLGFEEVSNIVLATTLIKALPAGPGDRIINVDRFWQHSVGVAVAARVISAFTNELPEDVKKSTFVAGLVHDIGKLVEFQYFGDELVAALNLCKQERLNLWKAEEKIFGFSHQDVGAYLLDIWNMPRNMVKAVELHETPEDLVVGDAAYSFVSVIHIANVCANFLEIGAAGDPFIPQISDNCWLNLNIDVKLVPKLLGTIKTGYEQVSSIIFQ